MFGLVLRRLRSREDRVRLSEVCRDWCASTRQHLRRRPGARAPVVCKAAAPAVAAPMAAVHLALPNGRVFSYPELTSFRLLDGAAAVYLGAACDDWLL